MEGTRLLCRSLTLAPETSSVQEQHGQRLRRKQDQLWGAQHRAWLAIEQGYPWQRYQYSIFTRERTTSGKKKKKKGVRDLIWQAVGCGCISWATMLSEKSVLVLMTKVCHSCGFSVPFFYSLGLYLHILHISLLRSPKIYCPQQYY